MICECERCGAEFKRKGGTKGRFCSPTCWYAAFESIKQPRPCKACGKPFKGKRRTEHCSAKCSHTAWTLDRTDPEPAPVDGARWVPLGHGRFALVDAEDFDRISAWKWSAVIVKGHVRRVSGSRPGVQHTLLHRIILDAPIVDHRNGDPLDNRRCNLRPATPTENIRNATKKSGNRSSRFKGVWRASAAGNWQAMIRAGDERRWLGGFSSEEDAARAYDAAARELHGEFACVNFPLEGERGALQEAS